MLLFLEIVLLFHYAEGDVPELVGKYKPLATKITIGDLKKGGSQQAVLWYPQSDTTQTIFPLVLFAHGMTCGGAKLEVDYKYLMGAIASHGFVLVAPMSCPNVWCPNFYEDVVITYQTCLKKKSSLHPALKTANFENVGVVGHSMGAMSAVLTGGHNSVNAKAVVALHPCFTNADPTPAGDNTVPTMYWTGTKDTTCPSSESEEGFKLTKYKPSTYSNLVGAAHTECMTGAPNRENPYVIQFLKCLTMSNATSCDIIEGTGKYSLCHNGNYTYNGCTISK